MGRVTGRAQPTDLGILLALAYQEFVRELREAHREDGFDDIGRSDGYVFRALATNPSLLLLDEPTEGLAPIIVQELLAALTRLLREEKLAAIIVEQHAQKILPITDRALILERGRIVHESASAVLLADPAPLERFLGVTAR